MNLWCQDANANDVAFVASNAPQEATKTVLARNTRRLHRTKSTLRKSKKKFRSMCLKKVSYARLCQERLWLLLRSQIKSSVHLPSDYDIADWIWKYENKPIQNEPSLWPWLDRDTQPNHFQSRAHPLLGTFCSRDFWQLKSNKSGTEIYHSSSHWQLTKQKQSVCKKRSKLNKKGEQVPSTMSKRT